MARLHFFVEGQTEQAFADTVLKPHLANHGVYVQKPVLVAHGRRRRRTHRGGGGNFRAMQADIQRRLKEDRSNDVCFTTMIDLYRLPKRFPGAEEAEKLRDDPYRRVEALETAWAEKTGDRRFIPFIQLHEYEAYLLCDVSVLADFFDHAKLGSQALQTAVDAVESPELIDDEATTAPSKRIIAAFPQYRKLKTTVGPQAAERVGLATIRGKCPHFDRWMQRLEGLGSDLED